MPRCIISSNGEDRTKVTRRWLHSSRFLLQSRVKLALPTNLVGSIGLACGIERFPSRFLPRCSPVAHVHRRLVQQGRKTRPIRFRNTRGYQGPASTDSLSIGVSIVF